MRTAARGWVGRTGRALALLLASAGAARASEKFAYFHNHNGGANEELRGYAVATDGALTELAGSPFLSPAVPADTGGFLGTLDAGKLGKQSYLFSGANGGVTVWQLGADGVPAPVVGSPFDGGQGASDFVGTTAIKRGTRLYVYSACYDTNLIVGFEVQDDGTLVTVPGSPFATGLGPCGIDAAGTALVCANIDGDSISAFEIGKDGTLEEAPGSPFPAPNGTTIVQLDSKGKWAWSIDDNDAIDVFKVDSKTKALATVVGAPFDLSFASHAGVEAPGSEFVLAFRASSANGEPDVDVLERQKDGALTLLGRHVVGFGQITGHAIDKKGKLLFVVGDDDSRANVATYRLDSKSGAMILADHRTVAVHTVTGAAIVEP